MQETTQAFERRTATRLQMLQAVKLTVDPNNNGVSLEGSVTGLSERGLSCSFRHRIPLASTMSVKLDLPNNGGQVVGQASVVWEQQFLPDGWVYGFFFQSLAASSAKHLSHWISHSLLDTGVIKDRRLKRTINSSLVTFTNRSGKKIVGFFDTLTVNGTAPKPLVIALPGFGETKTSILSLSYFLVQNGFNVLRYDASDHSGEGDGDILHCTLGKLSDDLISAMDFSQANLGAERIGVITTSLTSLVALRVATIDSRISYLGGLVPVVNLRHTLNTIYRDDLIGNHLAGKRCGIIDMLGYRIDGDAFLADSISLGVHFLEGVTSIIAQLQIPVHYLIGQNDPWVKPEDVHAALGGGVNVAHTYQIVPSTMHQLHSDPNSSRQALVGMTNSTMKCLQSSSGKIELEIPRIREIAVQSRIEKERRKLLILESQAESVQFWSAYLSRFHFIIRIPEYQEFYSKIQELMGDPYDGNIFLDAGCGNGSYGLWLLDQYLKHKGMAHDNPNRNGPAKTWTYVGLDFVPEALSEAKTAHSQMLNETLLTNRKPEHRVSFIYTLADLEQKLPFIDGYFNKICCNLVLSYLRRPEETLSELYRVLAPGGTLIVTTLRPYADLSLVYKKFMDAAVTQEEKSEARKLLANVGFIREKETEGRFRFFSESELVGMVASLGAGHPLICRSFANQANLALIHKR